MACSISATSCSIGSASGRPLSTAHAPTRPTMAHTRRSPSCPTSETSWTRAVGGRPKSHAGSAVDSSGGDSGGGGGGGGGGGLVQLGVSFGAGFLGGLVGGSGGGLRGSAIRGALQYN